MMKMHLKMSSVKWQPFCPGCIGDELMIASSALSHFLNQLMSIGPLGTNFGEISIKISEISFMMKMHLMSSVKWQPFCPGCAMS